MKNALILLAGGTGKRLNSKIPKQFLKIGNSNIIEYFLYNLDPKIFDIIVIAINEKFKKQYSNSLKSKFYNHNIKFSKSGKTRQISSKNSLVFLKKFNPKKVLIHDSARPLVSNKMIKKTLKLLDANDSAIPFIESQDYMVSKNNNDLSNDRIFNIQTPQGFKYKKILKAHMLNKTTNARDDSSVLEINKTKIKMFRGEKYNIKITKKDDLIFFKKIQSKIFRHGIGYDIHKINFASKKKLTLCGLKINHKSLVGHSDADVGYHAICDSILGSLSLKDIGFYFNNKNPKWKNANSKIFMEFCRKKLQEKNFKIVNLDINFICESPNINKISYFMKTNISKILKIPTKIISIKATTNEKVSLIGSGKAIAAEAIVQIINE